MGEILAVQKYIKVQREVDYIGFQQKYIEEERYMYLYKDKLVTRYHDFPLETIFDLSYKPFGSEGGTLYLHSNHGVYTYHLHSDPQLFIEAFKRHQMK
ncbi:hypothetical protein [Caldifermentibacillus hisashii]|uniref:hypothetical protein n=1 Tax=Caldifermentibacillus hisashii TaxID=996558 RepID=UPI001C0FEB9D|nr:hypothetical protein [Caldifermentibacillus hisashii]MBU5341652.1 hypothetical protein [Caldifermentibacillus hisashii]